MTLSVCQLYSDIMSTYSDQGNMYYLDYFLRLFGFEVKLIFHRYSEPVPQATIYVFGGGQDRAELLVARDLEKHGQRLIRYLATSYCLAICGGYQLLGRFYLTQQGTVIEGLNYLPVATYAGHNRVLGPIVIACQLGTYRKTVVGYENHSGKTYILDGSPALGTVLHGQGNNGFDKTEGIIYQNTLGTYLHGPILPRNPHLTYWWLRQLLRSRKPVYPIDLESEKQAHRRYLRKVYFLDKVTK